MRTRFVLCFGLREAALASFLLLAVLSGRGQSPVVINEVLADNRTALDNTGDFPDWIELYNVTGADVDLGDWSLTDVPLLPRKYVFPLGTIVPANGYLLVYCDDHFTSPGLHTGFALSDKGENVVLYASLALGATIQDQVAFGLQIPDHGIGRVPDGVGDFTLTTPTPLAANEVTPLGDASMLKINEWSALNGESIANPDKDWFEVYNSDVNPVELSGLVFTDQSAVPATNQAVAALSFVYARGFVVFTADDKTDPADNVSFKLSSTSGDRILLYQPDRVTLIDSVQFGSQTLNISQGRLPDGSATIAFFRTNQPTKGNSNFLPLPDVVINEILTHTDPPLEDAIELRNIGTSPVDISNWWLSDSRDQPNKFHIPVGTVLPAGGFVVFYEGVGTGRGFNRSGTGESPDFTLNSAHGGELYLFTADAAGNLTGYRRGIDFEAAENGVSFGRHILSTGESDMTAMSRRTFGIDNPASLDQFRLGTGLPNATPQISPIVISELYYHPPDIVSGTNRDDNSLDEYIELQNITDEPVWLFDPQFPVNTWRIRGGVDFDFPENRSLIAGETLLIVNFDPSDSALLNAFRYKFRVPGTVAILGPYGGKLANGGATVELERPDTPQAPPHPDAGYVPHLVVDRVKYSDAPPWPTTPDGTGDSLQRCQPDAYGSDPQNWTGAPLTPGMSGVGIIIRSAQRTGQTLSICFNACAGGTYSLQSAVFPSGTWTKVSDVTGTANADQCVNAPIAPGEPVRYFRIVSPAQP